MSLPSSPAPCYQPDQFSGAKVKLSNRALVDIKTTDSPAIVLRRVASVPNTSVSLQTSNSSSSSSHLSVTDSSHLPQQQQQQQAHSTPASPRPSLRASYSLQKEEIQVGPSDFEKVRMLGKGDVGRVYLVKHKKTEKLYALKGKQKTTTKRERCQI